MEKPDLSIQMKSTDTVHVEFLRVNRVRSLVHYSIENCHFVFKHGVNDVMLYRKMQCKAQRRVAHLKHACDKVGTLLIRAKKV